VVIDGLAFRALSRRPTRDAPTHRARATARVLTRGQRIELSLIRERKRPLHGSFCKGRSPFRQHASGELLAIRILAGARRRSREARRFPVQNRITRNAAGSPSLALFFDCLDSGTQTLGSRLERRRSQQARSKAGPLRGGHFSRGCRPKGTSFHPGHLSAPTLSKGPYELAAACGPRLICTWWSRLPNGALCARLSRSNPIYEASS
jgi:hypothetical protein